jgi:hypothetical protein
VYETCIFRHPDMGGFRDLGPRNIGVLKINNETKAALEDVTQCFTYMHYMHDHNRSENAAMSFAVIAHEGDTIQEDRTTPVDPNNTRSGNMKMKVETLPVVIAKFPRPGMPGSKVEPQSVRAQATMLRHAERMAAMRQNNAMLRNLGTIAEASAQTATVEPFAAASPTQMVGSDTLTAPSIPRRRGRPPKPR